MGNNIKRAIRERMAKTGETYATARMHVLAAGSLPEGQIQAVRPDDLPRFDYACHGPNGLPTGEGVLSRVRLQEPVMACDACGWFRPQSMVQSARCWTPDCTGSLYEWLHPGRVEILDPTTPRREAREVRTFFDGGSGKQGRFERLVETTIEIAEAASEAYAVPQRVRLDLNGASSVEIALAAHLTGLAPDDLRRIEILMYVGRDGEGVVETTADLKRDSHEITVAVVKGKLPVLAEYLRKGLRQAREEGVDLDDGWSVSPPGATTAVPPEMRIVRSSALGPWLPDPTPTLPLGTLTRFGATGVRPLFVVPMGVRWQIILASGMEPDLIRGSFAAPTSEIACLYADDYLNSRGYSGPGIGPLPSKYPALRKREEVWGPSQHEKDVLERSARCACGYVGEDIIDRGSPCPACGGITVIHSETLLQHVGSSPHLR